MKRFLLISGIILLLLGLLTFTLMYTLDFSSGYRAGTIVKMSHKGTLFKTYEGQLHQGGIGTGADGELASNIWEFSVEKSEEEVLKQIEEAVDGGYRIKLYYREKYVKFPWRGDTKYFVYKVTRVGDLPGSTGPEESDQR